MRSAVPEGAKQTENDRQAERLPSGEPSGATQPRAAQTHEDPDMKQIIILFAALLLSACTTDQSNKDRDKESSGPTVYGQINMSVDHVSAH